MPLRWLRRLGSVQCGHWLRFHVSRFSIQAPVRFKSVVATAQFAFPLDPPCGGGAGQPPSGPQPYDNNGVQYPDGEAGSEKIAHIQQPLGPVIMCI